MSEFITLDLINSNKIVTKVTKIVTKVIKGYMQTGNTDNTWNVHIGHYT